VKALRFSGLVKDIANLFIRYPLRDSAPSKIVVPGIDFNFSRLTAIELYSILISNS
jgi:hypothetical protein